MASVVARPNELSARLRRHLPSIPLMRPGPKLATVFTIAYARRILILSSQATRQSISSVRERLQVLSEDPDAPSSLPGLMPRGSHRTRSCLSRTEPNHSQIAKRSAHEPN